MNEYQKIGDGVVMGGFYALCKIITAAFVFSIVLSLFGFSLDDSDYSTWNRSGFSVRTDAKTGLQYLQRGDAIIPRLDASGNHMKADKE